MKNTKVISITAVCKTITMMFIISFIWMMLEKLIYGEVQPRAVDDIMLILLTPVFYQAMKNE